MDNVNVMRTGFFAPDFSLPDTKGELFHLSEHLSGCFVCLCFFPDGDNDKVNSYLKDLNSGLPKTAAGLPVKIIGISPVRGSHLKELQEKYKITFPLLSDLKMAVSSRYYVINDSSSKPSVHFSIFVIDDTGIIRYRASEVAGLSRYNAEEFKVELSKLI